ELIMCGRIKITIFELVTVSLFFEKAAPIKGSPPRHGIPAFDLKFALLTMPLKMRKLLSGTWTVVVMVVFEVVIPVAELELKLIAVPVTSPSVCVRSRLISRVTISELPKTGVTVKLRPMSRYSMLEVLTVVWLLFCTKEPTNGMFLPSKMVD